MMAKDLVAVERRVLTPTQFGDLADVPPELARHCHEYRITRCASFKT
jgi:hypothetical protein